MSRRSKVRRSFPNTVVIEVTERKPAAKLVSGGLSYVIDEDAYLLDYTALGDEYRLPVINGVAPSTNEPGKQLAFEDPLMLESLKGILTELVKSDWIENIGEINLEKIYSISFSYANRYTVLLGIRASFRVSSPYSRWFFRICMTRIRYHRPDFAGNGAFPAV